MYIESRVMLDWCTLQRIETITEKTNGSLNPFVPIEITLGVIIH